MSLDEKKQTRGERNNNPGNIREYLNDGVHWQGERATDDDPAFEEFNTPEDGIRALARVLRTYQRKHGLKTIKELINRWAPPVENNTSAYVKSVATYMSLLSDSVVDLEDTATLRLIVRAIIRHENGRMIYSSEQVFKGVARA